MITILFVFTFNFLARVPHLCKGKMVYPILKSGLLC